MQTLIDYLGTWLFLAAPLFILQTVLMVVALVHALRHPNYKTGNTVIWVIVIVAINLIGPILYFAIGKGEDKEENELDAGIDN